MFLLLLKSSQIFFVVILRDNKTNINYNNIGNALLINTLIIAVGNSNYRWIRLWEVSVLKIENDNNV